MKVNLTVVVLTYNEEARIGHCLENLRRIRRCVVVDSGSTDRTVEIAKIYGCDVYVNTWEGFAKQRNWALENTAINTEWVLFVDVDEVYPEQFFEWFTKELFGQADVDAVMVPSFLFFKSKRLKYAPGYPIYHPRLIRTDKVRFTTNHTGHGESVASDCRCINGPIEYEHYFYDGELSKWLNKHVRHAFAEVRVGRTEGATVTRRGRISAWIGHSLWRVPLRFLYHYVLRQGFRDGREGLHYSLMYTWFEATKHLIRVAGAEETEACVRKSTESSPHT